MWSKDFDKWNTLKQQLDSSETEVYFKPREVWYCSIGVNVGREEDGHNDLFERPILILKVFSAQLFWGVSLTSRLKPENLYYLSFRHDGVEYSAIISQLRLLDAKRLIRKLYTISPASFNEIQLRLIEEMATTETKSDSQ
jgi:hypothetical protein